MSVPTGTVWRVTEGSQLAWKSWDDEHVVFDYAAGSTHLLDAIAGEALQALAGSPANLSSLVRSIAVSIGVEPDTALELRIQETLDRFHDGGLIEPALT
ncbi:MAG TPA: HPr-rel-A system PqqD family peptide chaperone [Candidatus Binatia bacterium]|nr:HPr-rel-A system PqqD family peptide chaperone [Candidatus Binatia bacterium]